MEIFTLGKEGRKNFSVEMSFKPRSKQRGCSYEQVGGEGGGGWRVF